MSDTITFGRRQLFMLPTRYGLLFALLLAVQLAAAINYGNGLAYALTFLLGSVAVVSMLYTHRNLSQLRLSAGSSAPVFAGDLARFKIFLANDSAVPRLGICIHQDKKQIACVDIAAHDSAAVDLSLMTVKRGYLTAPPVMISTRFPLGLLYSWSRRMTLAQQCLVYARPAEPLPLQTSSTETFESVAGLKPGGDDFIGVREFHAGDSPHHVDWKAVARGGSWYTKQFGGAYQATLWLDWDTLAGLGVEQRLSVLTRWVLDAEIAGMLYGLRLPQHSVAPANGADHQHQCLKVLALFGLDT
ncbi:MAG: DUF58 domain-containing protein [Gammaproteobacteria bacterium]|nr:DUF58 domain-containing protein [Gammaproteobacteria bacterium]